MPQVECKPCIELVVYKVKQDQLAEFSKLSTRIHAALAKLPGFLSSKTLRSIDSNLYVDEVVWQTQADAQAAFHQFKTLQDSQAFLNCIESVQFSNHFEWIGN
jgi:heme-degrading monooxygenase HmoA